MKTRAEPHRTAWIAARIADITAAKNKTDLIAVMAAALEVTWQNGDQDAEDQLHAACAAKIEMSMKFRRAYMLHAAAKASPPTEGAQA